MPAEYIWSKALHKYVAFLCRVRGAKPQHLQYKFFVTEKVNRDKIVFEESFSEVPESFFELNERSVWRMDYKRNQIKIVLFFWNE